MVGGLRQDPYPALAVAVLGIAQGASDQLAQVLRLEGLEPEQPRPAHQRLIDFEIGVFGGGADQGEGAVFHPGQQCILLGGVEAVHLINEQDRAQAVVLQALPGGVHLAAQILDPRQHRVEAAEGGAGAAGDDPRQGRLARARRAMQDQVADPIGGDRPAQQPAGTQDRLLADEVVEAAGP